MTWTTEKPTQDGWYWRKSDCAPIIVKVYETPNKGFVFEMGEGFQYSIHSPGWHEAWAGPIPEPQEI